MTTYRIKKIKFANRIVPILCQNENGPCPLLAICNCLLLQQQILINSDNLYETFENLTHILANRLFESNPEVENQTIRLNIQKQIDDVIDILPNLQYGLDVIVRFESCISFEFTKELSAFDMFGMRIVHGWVYDPDDAFLVKAVGSKSYNQLVEHLIKLQSTENKEAELNQEAQVIDKFLHSNCQLTFTGLINLHHEIKENEICVFFRNNHFSTLYKRNGFLYLLVTDEGYAREASIVWEKLDEIDGDTEYVNSYFIPSSVIQNYSTASPIEAQMQENDMTNLLNNDLAYQPTVISLPEIEEPIEVNEIQQSGQENQGYIQEQNDFQKAQELQQAEILAYYQNSHQTKLHQQSNQPAKNIPAAQPEKHQESNVNQNPVQTRTEGRSKDDQCCIL